MSDPSIPPGDKRKPDALERKGGGIEKQISEAQRLCLIHYLRNAAEALTGAVSLVENRGYQPRTQEITELLRVVDSRLNSVIGFLSSGSFCVLTEQECECVAPFVKCPGKPDRGEGGEGR